MEINFETPQEKRKFFQSKEIQELLSFNEYEREAIETYQGLGALQINELVGDFISDNATIIKNVDYYTNNKGNNIDNIQEFMTTIQNIYSAMVKQSIYDNLLGEYRGKFRLYRGAAHNLKEENNSFISTTSNRNEAILFATSNNRSAKEHYFFDIQVDDDVLYLNMPRKGNENEVLLSPFVTIKQKSERNGEKDGIRLRIKDVEISNNSPRERSNEELITLNEEVLSNADEISKRITECIRLRNQAHLLSDDIEIAEEGKQRTLRTIRGSQEYEEMKAYYNERIETLYEQYKGIQKNLEEYMIIISEWKEKFRSLIEGKCNQIEQNLYKQVKQIREDGIKREEERKRIEAEALEKKRLEQEAKQNNATRIKGVIRETVKSAEASLSTALRARIDMKKTGVQYDSPVEYTLMALKQISYTNNQASERAVNSISPITALPQNLRRTQAELVQAEQDAFKRSIEDKVIEIRLMQEQRILSSELKEMQSKKIGVLDRVSGKAKKQEEAIRMKQGELMQVQAVAKEVFSRGLEQEDRYVSIHEMLAEIEFAKYKGMMSAQEFQELEKCKSALEAIYGPRIENGKRVQAIVPERVNRALDKKIKEDYEGKRVSGFSERVTSKISKGLGKSRKIMTTERVCNEVNDMVRTIERTESRDEMVQKNNYPSR